MEKFVSLTKNDDFGRAYRQGKSYGNNILVMYVFERGQGQETRVGISVSKKVGNSIVRHRIKRQLKECFRTHMNMWKDGTDIVVVARQSAKAQNINILLSALKHAGTHLGVYIRETENI